jgi:hypothetical protein
MDIWNFWDLIFISFLLMPIIAYAEIHYRLPFLPSLLFKKEPEIIFDLPLRGKFGSAIPLFLFIKDAHLYPVRLDETEIQIKSNKSTSAEILRYSLNDVITSKFNYQIIWIEPEHFPQEGEYHISAKLHYRNSRKNARMLLQDNYRGVPHPPFQIQIANKLLPKFDHWYWGDLHTHSSYTNDQVEFGAPLSALVQAAKSAGLDFIAVTDHSYDLDDHPDNFLQNDVDLQKWERFQEEITVIQKEEDKFIIIPGEEVSVGNSKNNNVHCLILNDSQFFPGKGDSAEKIFNNHPTLSLNELLKQKSEAALAIAAHPKERPPFSQRLILRRDNWTAKDLSVSNLDAMQILNDNADTAFYEGLEIWKKILLSGKRIGIVAGNDSHGNFNCFRQIDIPFIKMKFSRKHLLGNAKTAVFLEEYGPDELIQNIRKHRCVISTGPVAIIQVAGKRPAHIGDTVQNEHHHQVQICAKSHAIYGFWSEIALYLGQFESKQEIKRQISIPTNKLEIEHQLNIPNQGVDYIRLEAYTQQMRNQYLCFTNPIWFTEE